MAPPKFIQGQSVERWELDALSDLIEELPTGSLRSFLIYAYDQLLTGDDLLLMELQ